MSAGAHHPLGPPVVRVAPPGPCSRALAGRLAAAEAPGTSGFVGGRPPIVWEEARGARVRDADGNVYVDLTAGFGVVNVGHAHPRVVRAVQEQADRLLHGMGDVFPHPARAVLAERLARVAPIPGAQVYFATSGAEAVEVALKTAQLVTGRSGVAACTGAYHGLTYGALRVTSRPAFREPFAAALGPSALRLPFPDPFRPPLDVPRARLTEACLDRTHELLRAAAAAGDPPGAVIVEPVLGREGIVVPPPGWLAGLCGLSRESGALLVADEILTGFGRTGALFAVQAERVVPDVLVAGKGMAGGLPIAAAVAPADLLQVWERGGEALHTSTFLAHPLACAAALAALEVLAEERLVERAAVCGARIGEDLRELARAWPGTGEVRGVGMMWGLEVVRPGTAGEPDAARARAVAAACLARGVLVLVGGTHGNVLQITPPLVLSKDEWRFARAGLQSALTGAG